MGKQEFSTGSRKEFLNLLDIRNEEEKRKYKYTGTWQDLLAAVGIAIAASGIIIAITAIGDCVSTKSKENTKHELKQKD